MPQGEIVQTGLVATDVFFYRKWIRYSLRAVVEAEESMVVDTEIATVALCHHLLLVRRHLLVCT